MPKISELPAASSVSDDDLLIVVQGGVTKKAAKSLVADGGGATVPAAGLVGSDGTALTSVTTSAGVAALVSDETGTGSMVFNTSPTFLTDARYGVTPATTGGWRTANAWYWFARDSANGQNVEILGLSASDVIELGANTGNDIVIGAGLNCEVTVEASNIDFGSSAAQAVLRLASGDIKIRDATNTYWLTLARPTLGADQQLTIPNLTGADTIALLGLAQTFSAHPTFSTGYSVGGTVASAGTVRWANVTDTQARKADNSGDFSVLFCDASNNVSLGRETNTGDTYVQSGSNNYYRAPTHNFTTDAGAAMATLTSSTATWKQSASVVDGNARYKAYGDIANVQTTDATVTTLFSFTPTDEAVTLLTVEALAVLSTGAETNSYIRRCRIKRDGGTVTLGSVVDVSTDEETAAWDCTIDLSGTTVRVRVTGENAKTIDWGCTATRQVLTHA